MDRRDDVIGQLLHIVQRIYVVKSRAQEQDLIFELGELERPTTIAFMNQHAVNLAYRSSSFRQNLIETDYVFRDGVSVEMVMAVTGYSPGLNINGTDFIPKVLTVHGHKSVAVIGTDDPWLSAAVRRMQSDGINVTHWMDGFRRVEHYVEFLQNVNPDIIILAMGMPQQEELAATLADKLSHPCLIINGGAIVDFYGERFPRAPLWARNARLEWAYRLFKEPRRLSSRYLGGGLTFAWRLFRMWRLSAARQRQ